MELTHAIAEGQRFVQLLHGVEWMTTLCESVVDAEKTVAELRRTQQDLSAQMQKLKQECGDAHHTHQAAIKQYEDEHAKRIEVLDVQYSEYRQEKERDLASLQKTYDGVRVELEAARVTREAEYQTYLREKTAREKELAQLKDAVDALHAKIAAISG